MELTFRQSLIDCSTVLREDASGVIPRPAPRPTRRRVYDSPRVPGFAVLAALLFQAAHAAEPQEARERHADPLKSSCWAEAARAHGVDPFLLQAIAWKESRGWTNAVGPELPDGNRALGLMQINSIHLPRLATAGIRRDDLFDPCVSLKVGAWVLADCISQFGPTWRAVGCYYAGPASKNYKAQAEYVLDVQRFYRSYKRQRQPRPQLVVASASSH